MENKRSRSTFILLAALLTGLMLAVILNLILVSQAQAQIVIYVDDDTCPATGSGTRGNPYCRLQDAVDAAHDNYEIRVAAGTYTGVQSIPVQQARDIYTYTQVVIITKTLTMQGGYSPANWYTPDPAANVTVIDAQQQGRGISIVGAPHVNPDVTVAGFTITGGDYTDLGNPPGVSNQVCAHAGADCGGGLYAYRSAFTLRDCIVSGNVASQTNGNGGGIYIWDSAAPIDIENTRIIDNNAPGSGSSGGGLYGHFLMYPMTIAQSVFQGNAAGHDGGGITLAASIRALVTISQTDFFSNTVGVQSGGMYVRLAANGEILHMDSVRFQNNQAASLSAALFIDAAGNVTPAARLANLLFSDNSLTSADAEDAIVNIDGAFASLNVEMDHITAADNSASTFLYAQPSHKPNTTLTVTVKNALISFFTNAYAAAETGDGEVVLQHDNTLTQYVTHLHQNAGGAPTFIANNPLTGDPKLDATYHLRPGSAAIDAGVDAGVTTDIDGDVRPQGAAPDIGADEYHLHVTYLPSGLRNK